MKVQYVQSTSKSFSYTPLSYTLPLPLNTSLLDTIATTDALGRTTRYLVHTNRQYAQLLEEYSPDGTKNVFYVHGLILISQIRGNEESFYLYDGHSGVRQLTNESGIVSDTYFYDSYGNLLSSTGSKENNYLYRGEQFDHNLGMQYLRLRYYDFSLGRFTSVDPFEGVIESPVGRRQYFYGNANPITYVDPSGEFATTYEVLGGSIGADILSAISPGLAFGIAGTVLGGLGIGKVVNYAKDRYRNILEWEGTLAVNAFGDPSGSLLGIGPDFGFECIPVLRGSVREMSIEVSATMLKNLWYIVLIPLCS